MSADEHNQEILTFDKFREFANRKPSLNGSWVYQLTQAILEDDIKVHYPMFDLSYREEMLFLSFDDAINYLRDNKSEDVYCSWVRQIPVGADQDEHGAMWLLDENGDIIDYTTTYSFGEGEEARFYGRPPHRQRFKRGDIVEVVSKNKVQLAVLSGVSPDIEYIWENYNRLREIGNFLIGDLDEYPTVIDGPSYYFHEHISPLNLLAPRFPIPEDIKEEMSRWLEEADTIQEYQPTFRGEQNRNPGENAGEFYGLQIHLYFPDNAQSPLLLIDDNYGIKTSLHIDCPEYADYNDYTARLTSQQLKSLQDYLEEVEVGKSKWWYILRKWNEDEDHKPIPLDTPLPDYTTLIKE